MKERSILFNGEMVRATLDDRKRMTRRICALQHELSNIHDFDVDRCPYGKPGDRLWVREKWYQKGSWRKPSHPEAEWDDAYFVGSREIVYSADAPKPADDPNNRIWWRAKPSIHMPRWASRITLEITNVRVERLQDITENDAQAEGCSAVEGCKWHTFKEMHAGIPMHAHTARDAFAALWESINGDDSWDENPWVWVVEFKRLAA